NVQMILRPLTSLHLQTGRGGSFRPRGSLDAVLTVSAIGITIVLIACINFVNLMTARASRRAVEVGVRKVSGATRAHLVAQFIGETLIYIGVGMVVGLALAAALLPALNTFLDRHIKLGGSGLSEFIGFMAACVAVLGVLAGAYPAFVLTSF